MAVVYDSFTPSPMRSALVIAALFVGCVSTTACGEDPTAPELELVPVEPPPRTAPAPAHPREIEMDGPSAPRSGTTDSAHDPEAPETPVASRSPDSITEATIETVKTYAQEVGRLAEGDVTTARFEQDLSELRDRTILSLRELGRHRAELPDDEQALIREQVARRIGPETLESYRAVARLIETLKDTNPELANTIASDVPGLTRYVINDPRPSGTGRTNGRMALQKARQDLEAGRIEGAVKRLRAIVKTYPGTEAAAAALKLLAKHAPADDG